MSKSNGIMSAVGKIITWLLVVLLILGVAGGIAYFVLRSQGVTFYVECGNEKYFSIGGNDSLKLVNGQSHDFSVKSLTGENVDYSVKITSNGANNFLFTTGGDIWYLWNDDETKDDYTDIFGIEKSVDSFTLSLSNGFTVKQALEEKYGAEIELQNENDIQAGLCYFVIIVTVGENTVQIPFSFTDLTVTIDPPQIVF